MRPLRQCFGIACAALAAAAAPTSAQVGQPQSDRPSYSRAEIDAALQLYSARLLQTGQKHRSYPTAAFEQNLTGVATIEIDLGADGTLERKTLARSSGHRILDEHALQLMEIALPLTEIPSALKGRAFKVHVTVNYVIPE